MHESPETGPDAPVSRPRRVLRGTAGFLVALGGLGLLLALLGTRTWLGAFTLTLLPGYAAVAAAGAALALAVRARRIALPGVLCALACALWLAPAWLPPDPGPAAADAVSLRILSANLLERNRDAAAFLAVVADTRPDLVLTQESADPWPTALAPLHAEYPFHLVVPRAPRGKPALGVYARVPVTAHEALGDSGIPALVITARVGGRDLRVINAHTAAPWSPRRVTRHGEDLRRLAALVAAGPHPSVLAGDLNSSPWSPRFRALLRDGGLVDPRRGRGLLGTWPSMPIPLRTPIDHVLVSPEIACVRLEVGPHFGSDHRPLLADLRIPGAGP